LIKHPKITSIPDHNRQTIQIKTLFYHNAHISITSLLDILAKMVYCQIAIYKKWFIIDLEMIDLRKY
jgi:hypothetical protein